MNELKPITEQFLICRGVKTPETCLDRPVVSKVEGRGMSGLSYFYADSVRPELVEGLLIRTLYILRCADNSYYTGHTDNLEQRMAQHQTGEIECYTSTRLPVRLIYSEDFASREEALACERKLKGWSRKKKAALVRGDWSEISRLARGEQSLK